jgi:hypothetical protein
LLNKYSPFALPSKDVIIIVIIFGLVVIFFNSALGILINLFFIYCKFILEE